MSDANEYASNTEIQRTGEAMSVQVEGQLGINVGQINVHATVETVDAALVWIAQQLEHYKLENHNCGFRTGGYQEHEDDEPVECLMVWISGTLVSP